MKKISQTVTTSVVTDNTFVPVIDLDEPLAANRNKKIQVSNLIGPKGDPGNDGINGIDGVDGKSAYEVAVDNGFLGTEEDWLISLKGLPGENGENGQDGEDGKSAYEIAVDDGFVGTETEWIESIYSKIIKKNKGSWIPVDTINDRDELNPELLQPGMAVYINTLKKINILNEQHNWEELHTSRAHYYNVLDYNISPDSENIKNEVRNLYKQVGESGGGVIYWPAGIQWVFTPDEDGYGIQIQWDNVHTIIDGVITLQDPEKYMRNRGANPSGLFHVGGPIPGIDSPQIVSDNAWGFDGYNYFSPPETSTLNYKNCPYLTVAPKIGDRIIHVNDTSHFSSGSWVFLRTNDFFRQPGDAHKTIRSELVRVKEVLPDNRLQLNIAVCDDYKITSSLYILAIPIRLVDNVTFTGKGSILNSSDIDENDLAYTGQGSLGIYHHYHSNGKVIGLTAGYFENSQLQCGIGINYKVDDVTVFGHRLSDESGNPKNGFYGISVRGAQQASLTNITGFNLRHVVDTGIDKLLTRILYYGNISGTGCHASVASTHAVENLIADNIKSTDSSGGLIFRGHNLILNGLDVSGHNKLTGSTGALSIGAFQGGPDGLGDSNTLEHKFGSIIVSGLRTRNIARPLMIYGSCERILLDNLDIVQIKDEEHSAITFFAHEIGDFKLSNSVIDSTLTVEDGFGGAFSFWKWSATPAPRGTISFTNNTFINPSSWVGLIHGNQSSDDSNEVGDYFFKDNVLVLNGEKTSPRSFFRLESGYFGFIESTNNHTVGSGAARSNQNSVDIRVPYSHLLRGLPNNSGSKDARQNQGGVFVEPYSIDWNKVSVLRGQRIIPANPSKGMPYEKVCTQSGTYGIFKAKGSIENQSDILTLDYIEEGEITAGQWLLVESAGSVTGFTPLRAMIVSKKENKIKLSDIAQNTVTLTNIGYATPIIASLSVAGGFENGETEPFGNVASPIGSIYTSRGNSLEKRPLWVSSIWDDPYSWEPAIDPSKEKGLRKVNANALVGLALSSNYKNDISIQGLYDLFANYPLTTFGHTLEVYIPGTFSNEIIKYSNGTYDKGFNVSNNGIEYTGILNGIKKTYTANQLTINDLNTYIRKDLVTKYRKPGIEFQGRYQNFLIENINNWNKIGLTAVETSNTAYIGEDTKTILITERTESSTQRVLYKETPLNLTGVSPNSRLTFSMVIDLKDGLLWNDRCIQIEVVGTSGQYGAVIFDPNDIYPTVDDYGWPVIYKITDGVYRISVSCPSGSNNSKFGTVIRLLDGNRNRKYDTSINNLSFGISNPQVSLSREALRWAPFNTSIDSLDQLTMPVDLHKNCVSISILPRWVNLDHCLVKFGDYEIWTTGYRGNSYEDTGIYLRKDNTIIPWNQGTSYIQGGTFLLGTNLNEFFIYCNGLVVFKEVKQGNFAQNLIIGGHAEQNFIIGHISILDSLNQEYDLNRASSIY